MSLSVAILGSGNMAFHLLSAFDKASVTLRGLISRDLGRGMETLDLTKAKCELIGGLNLTELDADIIILAVPESSIEKVQKLYSFDPNHLVVHTSGAEPIDSLKTDKKGVFYPLQSLSWGKPTDFGNIPILIESPATEDEASLKELAASVSDKVISMKSTDRLIVHLAAVIVNNFPNLLYKKADELLSPTGQGLEILKPLIYETAKKAFEIGPTEAQTGPATRADTLTIERHEELLKNSSFLQIYQLISEEIKKLKSE